MKKSRNQKLKPAAAMFSCFIVFFFLLVLVGIDAKAQSNKWIAPKEADNVKNPLAGNTDVLKEGKTLYTSYCTPCHGEKGKGDGVAAASLSTKPADHSSAYVQSQTDGAIVLDDNRRSQSNANLQTMLLLKINAGNLLIIYALLQKPQKNPDMKKNTAYL